MYSMRRSFLLMITANRLKRTNSFFRFLLVGLLNTIIGLSLMFFFLKFFHMSYWLSTFIGNSIGAAVSYFLNRSFTFNSNIAAKIGIPKFVAVILFSYVFSYSISLSFIRIVPLSSSIPTEEIAIL